MILRHPLLRRNVTECLVLKVFVSSHPHFLPYFLRKRKYFFRSLFSRALIHVSKLAVQINDETALAHPAFSSVAEFCAAGEYVVHAGGKGGVSGDEQTQLAGFFYGSHASDELGGVA